MLGTFFLFYYYLKFINNIQKNTQKHTIIKNSLYLLKIIDYDYSGRKIIDSTRNG